MNFETALSIEQLRAKKDLDGELPLTFISGTAIRAHAGCRRHARGYLKDGEPAAHPSVILLFTYEYSMA